MARGFSVVAVLVMGLGLATPHGSAALAQTTATAEASVTGFRSAQFGMSEDAVRSAIISDFPQADTIRLEENQLERTRALVVNDANVLPGGGAAVVAYLLGHTSGKLFQVNVVWGDDGTAAPDLLLSNASVLANHFQGRGFSPDRVVQGRLLDDGRLLVFQGEDAQGRTVQLVLSGPLDVGAEGTATMTPSRLHLSYIADPKAPDVFRLSPDQF